MRGFTRSVTAITGATYLSMFFVGVALAVVGAAARDVGLAASQVGLLVGAKHAGFALSVAVCGVLADTRSKPRLMAAGSAVLAPAFALLFVRPELAPNVALMVLAGAGIGAYEGASDPLLLDLHAQQQSRRITVNHAAVTAGSIGIAAWLLLAPLPWRASLAGAGGAVALLGLFFLPVRVEAPRGAAQPWLARVRGLGDRRGLAVVTGATVLSVAAELAATAMLTTFLAERRGFSAAGAKAGLLLFLCGMAAGRALNAWLGDDRTLHRRLAWLFPASAAAAGGLLAVEGPAAAHALCALVGLTLSAQVPLLLSVAGLRHPQARGTVLGLLKVAIPAGGVLGPALASALAGAVSLDAAMFVLPAFAGLGSVLVGAFPGAFATQPAPPEAGPR